MDIRTRQRKPRAPCSGCGLRAELCLCADIPRLVVQTAVSVIVHARELKRTTNTGRLVHQALVGSDLLIRGAIGKPLDLAPSLRRGFVPVLLFPGEGARELTDDVARSFGGAVQLIVPDGNWRQASKVGTRHPELRDVARVFVAPEVRADRAHLRRESTDIGMSTLQAVAYALGVLEGENVKDALLALYELKLARTLAGRAGVLMMDQVGAKAAIHPR